MWRLLRKGGAFAQVRLLHKGGRKRAANVVEPVPMPEEPALVAPHREKLVRLNSFVELVRDAEASCGSNLGLLSDEEAAAGAGRELGSPATDEVDLARERLRELQRLNSAGSLSAVCRDMLKSSDSDQVKSTAALLEDYFCELDLALLLRRRALELDETDPALGLEHAATAASAYHVAELLRRTGDCCAAEVLYRRALSVHEGTAACANTGSVTVAYINNLATLLMEQGQPAQLEEAERLLRRALRISGEEERGRGGAQAGAATSVSNLAVLLKKQGRFAEAEPLYRRALRMDEASFGCEHAKTAGSVNNLAVLLTKQAATTQGSFVEAEALCRRALATAERALGPDHTSTATSMHNLADVLQLGGKLQEAEPLLARALEVRADALGLGHRSTASTLGTLVKLLAARGAEQEVRELRQRFPCAC
jgi:tetratricopeptide (TPR) repeat protein